MKTRAWDGKQWRTDYIVKPNGDIWQVDIGGKYEVDMLLKPVNWKLSRFTGLCDLDNTDVYEHHIVENEFGVRYVVAWDQENCRFRAKQPVHRQQPFCDLLTSSYNYPFDDHFVTYVKVTGNIFQNPELLEV